MSAPILTTKLFIPPPPTNLVARPRLIEKLDQGLGRKLTILSAPAGFGKTTLLSECVAQCKHPVVWYSLDENDNDTTRFLTYFIAALQTIYPEFGLEESQLLRHAQPPNTETILARLINQLANKSRHTVFVLDDYHHIESLEIDQAVSFLITNLPLQLHLVIATRTDPTFPLSRLRSQRQLTEIRVDDLRFLTDEIALFLKKRMGLKISTGDITTLESRTEGWIAGLQLAALSMQRLKKGTEIAEFIQNFSSSNRFILDYLTDEVLEQRPKGTQDFLLKTSILERLSGSLCDFVTGVENGQEILEALEAANLFIIPLDSDRVWYRYHHLFSDLLSVRLYRLYANLVPELHKRASQWYAENDLISEAINHSLAAGDFEIAAELTEQTFIDRMSRGEDLGTMLARLIAIPDEIIRVHPRLGIMFAWMLSLTLQLEGVEPRLVDIETRFGDQLPEDLKRQIACIRNEVLRHRGNYPETIKGSLEILESLPKEMTVTDQQTYTGLVSNLSWGYLLSGNVDQSLRWFSESLAIGQHSITLTLIGLFGVAFGQELQGHLQKAIDTCLQGLKLAEETPHKIDNEVPAEAYIHLRLGSILRERNQLEESEHHLNSGLEMGHKWGTIADTMRDGYIDLAKLKLSQGDFQGGLDVLNQAEKRLHPYRSIPSFDVPIEAQKAHLRIARSYSSGDHRGLDGVATWAEKTGFEVDQLARSIHQEHASLVWVRFLLAQHKPELALEALQALITSAEKAGRYRRVLEMKVLQSRGYQACGDALKAITALESALSIAEPEGYVRVFVDEGPALEALLQQAVNQDIASSYVAKLLDAFHETPKAETTETSQLHPVRRTRSPLVEPLSEREREVLNLLEEGFTNREIAAELVIAVTTAKKHVSNIIGKLGVTNRTQAVSRAKELNLI